MIDTITGIIIPSASGAFVAFAEAFLRGQPIPTFFTKPVRRGDPFWFFLLAFSFYIAYALVIAHWIFVATDSRQYFLTSAAAVAILISRAVNSRTTRTSEE